MTTYRYSDLILTIALHHSNHPRVLTAVIEGNKDFARETLKSRVLNDVEESEYLLTVEERRLAPHERAARLLNNLHGPRLTRETDLVMTQLIPD
jgi:hypothetical protein